MEFQGVYYLISLWDLEQGDIRREAPGDAVGRDGSHALQVGDGVKKFRSHLGDQLTVPVVERVCDTVITHDLVIEELVRTINSEGATIGHTKTLRHLLLTE
jgi:hypothetical protein